MSGRQSPHLPSDEESGRDDFLVKTGNDTLGATEGDPPIHVTDVTTLARGTGADPPAPRFASVEDDEDLLQMVADAGTSVAAASRELLAGLIEKATAERAAAQAARDGETTGADPEARSPVNPLDMLDLHRVRAAEVDGNFRHLRDTLDEVTAQGDKVERGMRGVDAELRTMDTGIRATVASVADTRHAVDNLRDEHATHLARLGELARMEAAESRIRHSDQADKMAQLEVLIKQLVARDRGASAAATATAVDTAARLQKLERRPGSQERSSSAAQGVGTGRGTDGKGDDAALEKDGLSVCADASVDYDSDATIYYDTDSEVVTDPTRREVYRKKHLREESRRMAAPRAQIIRELESDDEGLPSGTGGAHPRKEVRRPVDQNTVNHLRKNFKFVKYDGGVAESFERFVENFEAECDHMQYFDETTKLMTLKASLTGEALTAFKGIANSKKKRYLGAIEELRGRFTGQHRVMQAQRTFERERLDPEKGAQAFADRLSALARVAWPDFVNPNNGNIVKSMKDSRELEVRTKLLRSVPEVVKVKFSEELYTLPLSQLTRVFDGTMRTVQHFQATPAAEANNFSGPAGPPTAKPDDTVRHVKSGGGGGKQKKKNPQPNGGPGHSKPKPPVKSGGDTRPKGCFRCGDLGHWVSDCSLPKPDEEKNKENISPRNKSAAEGAGKPSGSSGGAGQKGGKGKKKPAQAAAAQEVAATASQLSGVADGYAESSDDDDTQVGGGRTTFSVLNPSKN